MIMSMPPDGQPYAEAGSESSISTVIFTNSIPVFHKIGGRKKFVSVSIIPLLAEASKRIILKQSISELHTIDSIRILNLL